MTTTKIELTPEQITALTTDLTEIPKKAINSLTETIFVISVIFLVFKKMG